MKNIQDTNDLPLNTKNEAIAKFLELPRQDISNGGGVYLYEHPDSGEYVLPDELEFEHSLNCIFMAVNKINNLTDEHGNPFNFTIGNGYVWIDQYIGDRIYFSGNDIGHRAEPMIDKIYRGVIKFIEWQLKN